MLFPSDIMTPRTVVIAFPENRLLKDAAEDISRLAVSRILLYRESMDVITGFVLKTDLLLSLARDEENVHCAAFKREIPMFPETLALDSLFEKLLERQEHIAAIIDEYGGLSGIVTQEDIVETLLGLEITDEQDSITDMQAFARRQWNARAKRLGLIE